MADERRIQLAVEVDASQTRPGFDEVRREAGTMATSVERSGERASRAVDGIGEAAVASSRQMGAAERNMVGSIQRATAALEAGSRSGSRYYEVLATQRGVDRNVLEPYLAQLRAVEAAQARSTAAVAASRPALDGVGVSAAQTAAALRGVPAQFTDIVTSLQGGQQPLTVFLQQGGQLRDTFGDAGAAARGMAGYVASLVTPMTAAAAASVLLGVAYNQGSKEADAYNRAIVMTGNAVGTTSERLADMARNVGKAVGTQGQAAAVVAELAGTGKVGADNLQRFSKVALDVEKTVGRSVSEMARDLSLLADAPLEASKKLNEQYRYLTSAVYDQIRALQEQGRTEEAAAVAQTAYTGAFEERSKMLESRLGVIEKSWRAVKSAASSTWDAILGVGREETTASKLERVSNGLASKQAGLAQRVAEGKGGDRISSILREDIAQIQAYKATLDAKVDGENRLLAIEAEKQAFNAADIKWKEQGLKLLSKQQQMATEIASTRQTGEAAGYSDEEIDKRIALVKKKYGELGNLGTTALEIQRSVEKEMLAGRLATLESQHKQLLMGDAAYYQAKRDLQLQDLNAQTALLKAQAKDAEGAGDLVARQKYLGELRVLEQRRANIIRSAQESIAESAAAGRKALADQLGSWSTASANELAQLRDEEQLIGQSTEARKISAAQLKIDAEARQFLAAQLKQGRQFSAQELEDLRAGVKARKDSIAAIMGEQQALAGAAQLRAENQRFGADAIVDERARAAALLDIEASTWRERIRLAGEGTTAQKQLQEEYDRWYANQLIKPQLEAQRELWRGIESTAHDTFVSILDSGKSTSARLKDSLKNGVFEWLYQMTGREWVINIRAALTGSDGFSGALQAASGSGAGGGNVMNLLSAGKTLWNGFSTGLNGSIGNLVSSVGNLAGSQWLSSVGSGISGGAGTSAAASAYAQAGNATVASGLNVGATISTYMPMVTAAVASYFGAKAIAGKYRVEGIGSLLNYAGLAGGVVNRAFGRGPKETTGQTITGMFDEDGLENAKLRTDWVKKGGWFRSNKKGSDEADLDPARTDALNVAYKAIKDSTSSFAAALGVPADVVTSYTKQLSLVQTGDAAKDQAALTQLFADMGDELAGRVLPNIADFIKQGEQASGALQRLATEFKTVDGVLTMLGLTSQQAFGAAGVASLAARDRLVQAAGGNDALTSQSTYFAQNFLSQAEQLAPAQKAVSEQMAALGYASVTTNEQFKAAVTGLAQSGALATEVGAKTYAGLLAIAPQFKLVADYAKQVADADAAGAVKAAADALQRLKDSASVLSAGVDTALSAVSRSVKAQRDTMTSAYETAIKSLETSIDGVSASLAKTTSLSDLLKGTLSGMAMPGQEAASRAAAQAQIQTALAIAKAGGPLPDADSLREALSIASKSNIDDFASMEDYQRDFARTAASIEELSGLTGTKLTAEQQQLKLLQEQKDAAKDAYAAEGERLDQIIEEAQKQVDVLNGVAQGVQAIPVALEALTAAIAAAMKNPVAAAPSATQSAYSQYLGRDASKSEVDYWTGQAGAGVNVGSAIAGSDEAYIQSLYRELLGRTGEAAGVDSWERALSQGQTRENIRAGFMASDEYKRLHPFAVGTNYVPQTMPALVHEGERIIPAADNRALMQALNRPAQSGDPALLEEIRALREEVRQLKASSLRNEGNTGKAADLIERVSAGGNAFAVEVMNA